MIEVRDLVRKYDEHLAVAGISFTVEKGDIYGFIGPNGAGKTTTIRILSTLLEPTSGDVRVGGRSVIRDPYEVRKLVGYMPDLFGVYDRVTVWEYLDFFSAAYRIDRARRRIVIEGVLELTDLGGVRDRLCIELSKGMKQRLCLAKTLVHDPQVLVLDEPASGLDPRARIEFRALLKELREMGKTIFLSSHILTELSDVCNAVAIMEKGRIVASGTIQGILERLQPKRAYAVTVLDRAEEARGIIEGSGAASSVSCADHTVRFHLEGPVEGVPRIVKALSDGGIPIVGLEEVKENLEGLFMQLTRGEVA